MIYFSPAQQTYLPKKLSLREIKYCFLAFFCVIQGDGCHLEFKYVMTTTFTKEAKINDEKQFDKQKFLETMVLFVLLEILDSVFLEIILL